MPERHESRCKTALFYTGVTVAFAVGVPLALWLAWLAIAAFILYGFNAIVWVLS